MACSIPVVASGVGVNSEIVDHGQNGYLAGTNADWKRFVGRLCDDPVLRKRLGSNGRKKVEKNYCLQITAPRLSTLIKGCL